MRSLMILLVALTWAPACSTPSAGNNAPVEHRMVTGAVLPEEGILGRVGDGNAIRLLTGGHRIVTIDLNARRAASVAVHGVEDDDMFAGFGRLPDGSLWTLSGWTTLVRLREDGRVMERRQLLHRQAGLHAGFDHLVYQPLDFTGGSPALVILPGDETTEPVPWGTFRVREGAEQGALRLGQSLVTCGVAVADRIPCWQPNAAMVELIDRDGRAVHVRIPALQPWTSNDEEFARHPQRVIRDVWLTSPSSMWLLTRRAARDLPDRAGERGLWKVSDRGDVIGSYVIRSRARMILGVERGRVVVLTAEGHVVSEEV